MANNSKSDDDTKHNARVGSVIKGKWTIDSLLGVGGMAVVYAASHRNGQRAALKILHADFAREKVICERFLREAYVSNKVNHGATVQVLDDDVTEAGEPFLIMELLEGETVRDAWKKSGKTMAVGHVLQICERILDCLASCHAIKVIHRDLKPANIFILKDQEIRVLDFGVAQMRDATSEKTATGTALGTPAYMSPEQAMGLVDQLDGRADLFSVGAMLHALMSGHRINNGRTEQEALVMAATKPVPSVARLAPHLPVELIKTIDKSLAWDRRNRFQDAREMQKALLELMPAQGVTPLPGRPAPRPHEVVAPPLPAIKIPTAPPAPPPRSTSLQGMPAVLPASKRSMSLQGMAAVVPDAPPRSTSLRGMAAVVPGGPERPPSRMMKAVEAPSSRVDPMLAFSPSLTPGSSPPGRSPLPDVLDSDPRILALRDLTKHLDRVFPSVRQLGWAHPATERTLRIAYDAFVDALARQPDVVDWALRPYSFMSLGYTVWEPGPPFDAVPYNLFACGMRSLKIEPGITFEELKELFTLWLLDPGRDLPPEDDLAAALWEKGLPHVKWQCVEAFAEGDASEREAFYGEADQLESIAEAAAQNRLNLLEVQAMALSTDDAALAKQRDRSPFALDDVAKQHLAQHFSVDNDAWAERFVDALVEGYLDAAAHRDAPLVLSSLRRSSADLIVAGRVKVAVQINRAVVDRLRARVEGEENQAKLGAALTNAMFGGDTLEILLKHLQSEPSGVDEFGAIVPGLAPNEFATVLARFREAMPSSLRTLLATYIERHAVGHETELGQAAVGADPSASAVLVQLLARMTTPAARQVLVQLGQSEDASVRVEARVLVAPSPEHAQLEVGGLFENPSALVRMAALRTATRYAMRNTWPNVARAIGAKNFNELGIDERRELLRSCVALSSERGEPLLLELVKKGSMLTSEGREATRALAAEILGDLSRSRPTMQALQEISTSRWGTSDETRLSAGNAAKRIGMRIAQQGSVNA